MATFFFVLDSRYTRDTTCQDWFDLDNSLTRRNRPIFKIQYLQIKPNNSNFPYEKLTFFLGKL